MADPFWTEERIRELERDLDVSKDSSEDAAWLLERLNDIKDGSKAEKLGTLDSISQLHTLTWEGENITKHSRLIGWLHDWRMRHSE